MKENWKESTYDPLLQDANWIEKREEVLKRDDYKCRYCGDNTKLEVHHIFYMVDKLPWQYPDKLLITLCSECHSRWHKLYGIEYCSNTGKPLTLYVSGRPRKYEKQQGNYFVVPFEERDDEGNKVYSGEALTWAYDALEIDDNFAATNFYLSRKDNGMWIIHTDSIDSYHFKHSILKQQKIITSKAKKSKQK